jgi:hypothetical protein
VGYPIGCGRILVHGDEGKTGRMAVLKSFRKHRVGRSALRFLVKSATSDYYPTIEITNSL